MKKSRFKGFVAFIEILQDVLWNVSRYIFILLPTLRWKELSQKKKGWLKAFYDHSFLSSFIN